VNRGQTIGIRFRWYRDPVVFCTTEESAFDLRGERLFCSQQRSDRLWCPPSYRRPYPGVEEVHETAHSLSYISEVKYAWSYTSISQCVFLMWCLIKHTDLTLVITIFAVNYNSVFGVLKYYYCICFYRKYLYFVCLSEISQRIVL
jgi:hypothetical protein